jgi:PAS domain S-box-containing protein
MSAARKPSRRGSARLKSDPGEGFSAQFSFWHFNPAETRVLAIDDDEFNRDMISRLLKRAGFPVVCAATGNEGLREIQNYDPDLVVCDVMLPDISGFEICRQIKSSKKTAHIFVALISSQETSSESKVAGLGSGADEYIARPINNKELVARIHALGRIQQAALALRVSEQRFLTLAQTAPTGIVRTDPHGNIVYVNDYWCELTGHKSNRAIGKRWDTGVHFDDIPLVSKLLNDQTGSKSECRLFRSDKSIRWVLLTAAQEVTRDGEVTGHIGALIDITERKNAENQLAALNQSLDKQVATRTAQLARTNEILLREVKERKRAEEELKQIPHRIIEAQETERRRVARELHDGVSQILASVRFRIRNASQTIVDLGNEKLSAEIVQAERHLESALQEVRNISHDLRPSELDDLGLLPAIRSLVTHFEHRSGVDVSLDLPRWRSRIDPGFELALYRISQEALSNIDHHANASVVEITLTKDRKGITLVIRDDGDGFTAPQKRQDAGLGLINIRERAESIDGSVVLQSPPTGGVRIEVFVPLKRKQKP